jgi:hypothetical protein
MVSSLKQKLASLTLVDKADDDLQSSPQQAFGGADEPNPETDFDDGSPDQDEDNTGRRNGLALQFINTPALIKQINALWNTIKGDDEDHSGYAQFILEMDGVCRKYRPTGFQQDQNEMQGDQFAGDNDSQQQLGDPSQWK